MNNLQKIGGLAALLMALAYLVGITLNFTVLDASGIRDSLEKMAFLADNQALLTVWILFIYVIFGVLLVVLALALFERLKATAPGLAQVATAYGLIWAGMVIASGLVYIVGLRAVVEMLGQNPQQAAWTWSVIEVVHEGVGAGIEIPGGLWALLVSLAALRAGVFPRALNYMGVVIGAAGLLTVFPPLYEVTVAVFGLGQIIWWIWMGVVLLRSRSSAAVKAEAFGSPSAATP